MANKVGNPQFAKGNKFAGSRKGKKNKKTVTWETFANYCVNGGLEKFSKEMNSLDGKDFCYVFLSALEFHKPRQARTEVGGINGQDLSITVLSFQDLLKTKKSNGDNPSSSVSSS